MVSSLVVMRVWNRRGRNRGFYAHARRIGTGILVIAAAASLAPGCATGGPAPSVEGYSTAGAGLWEHVEAATAYAAPRAGLAVLRTSRQPADPGSEAEGAPAAIVFEFLSTIDRRALLRAEPGPSDDAGRATVGTIEVQWLPFPDEARERALAEAVRDRLRELMMSGGIAP